MSGPRHPYGRTAGAVNLQPHRQYYPHGSPLLPARRQGKLTSSPKTGSLLMFPSEAPTVRSWRITICQNCGQASHKDIAELDELVGELLLASRLQALDQLDHPEEVDLLALLAEEGMRSGVGLGLSLDARLRCITEEWYAVSSQTVEEHRLKWK